MSLSDETLAQLVDYVDGRMGDEQDRFRFEERLTTEPLLAEAFESYSRTSLLERRLVAPDEERSDPAGPTWTWRALIGGFVGLAAAAGILGWVLGVFTPAGPPEQLVAQVGIFETGLELDGTNAALRPGEEELATLTPFLDETLRGELERGESALDDPPLRKTSRGQGEEGPWDRLQLARQRLDALAEDLGLQHRLATPPAGHPEEPTVRAAQEEYVRLRDGWDELVGSYLTAAASVLEARAAVSLDEDVATPLEAEFFHVVVQPDEDCYGVVFIVASDGVVRDARGAPAGGAAHPADDGGPWTDETGRLAAGVRRFLPGAPLLRGAQDDVAVVDAPSGFMLPWRSEAHVLVALRRAPLTEALRLELGALIEELHAAAASAGAPLDSTARGLTTQLEQAGFVVSGRTVVE